MFVAAGVAVPRSSRRSWGRVRSGVSHVAGGGATSVTSGGRAGPSVPAGARVAGGRRLPVLGAAIDVTVARRSPAPRQRRWPKSFSGWQVARARAAVLLLTMLVLLAPPGRPARRRSPACFCRHRRPDRVGRARSERWTIDAGDWCRRCRQDATLTLAPAAWSLLPRAGVSRAWLVTGCCGLLRSLLRSSRQRSATKARTVSAEVGGCMPSVRHPARPWTRVVGRDRDRARAAVSRRRRGRLLHRLVPQPSLGALALRT